MNYIGEHLLPGQIGHFLAILSFVSSLIASYAYFIANKEPYLQWRQYRYLPFLD